MNDKTFSLTPWGYDVQFDERSARELFEALKKHFGEDNPKTATEEITDTANTALKLHRLIEERKAKHPEAEELFKPSPLPPQPPQWYYPPPWHHPYWHDPAHPYWYDPPPWYYNPPPPWYNPVSYGTGTTGIPCGTHFGNT